MPSERVQRQIDRLLDEAEEAMASEAWDRVADLTDRVLTIDPANSDALAFRSMAQSGTAEAPGSGQSLGKSASPLERPAPETPEPLPHSFQAGRYRVTGFLGEGGRKRVYLAHDTRLDRDVAFALIKTEGLDAQGRERIQREAQAMGRLSGHPHIVTIHDVGEEAGQPYIVSEYMAGGDVESLLRQSENHQLELGAAIEIGGQVAQALEHAHAAGVVHRDVKPGNIWLSDDRTAKLGDFGLAFAASETRMTTEGTMLGTVVYMPPEQALGQAATPRSDLYALGCVLYEMVAGRPPFLGDDAVAVISQHLNAAPVAPSWNRRDCPLALEDLIHALLAKAPEERPPSAAAVHEALARVDLSTEAPTIEHPNPLERLVRGAFVGRESEMTRLRRALDSALGGHGALVMLVGEPGIGKTRTTLELETYARLRGAQVHWGRNHEGSGAPAYWPWIQMGRTLGNAIGVGTPAAPLAGLGSNVNELVRIFPELRELLPNFQEPDLVDDPDASQFRLFDAYAQFIRGASQLAPLVLVLDDLHWADKPSLLLLQHLAREIVGMRVFVLGTFRDTDLVRTHPLSEALATLNRESGFERIVLRGLSRDEARAYILATANVDPSRTVLDAIVAETEGNPFFLSEVVNLMAEEGTLAATSLSDIAIPDGVREALGRRLDRLSDEANALLQTASVIGREFPYDTLGALAPDASDDSLLHLIEEGLEARVIEEMDRPGRYRFTHHLMQETLLNELSTTRRVRIHGQIGEALESRFGERADERASRLARHFVEASTLSERHAGKAIHYCRLAAQQAEAQGAYADAARHYEDALTVLAGAEHRLDEDEADLLIALGIASRNGGDPRVAWRSLMRATDLFRARGDGLSVARAAAAAIQLPTRETFQTVLTDALRELDGADPYLEALLSADLAVRFTSDPALLARAAALAEAHNFFDVQAVLAMGQANQILEADNVSAQLERALELAQRSGQVRTICVVAWNLCQSLASAGRLDDVETRARANHAFASRHGQRFFEENEAMHLAGLHAARAEWEQLDEVLQGRTGDQTYSGNLFRCLHAERRGDFDTALRLLPGADIAGGVAIFASGLHGSRARILFHAGDTDAAHREVERFEPYCRRDGPPLVARNFLSEIDDAIRFVDNETVLGFLAAEADNTLAPGRVAPGGINLAAGMSRDRGVGYLYIRLGRWDEAEQRLRASAQAFLDTRCPVEAGLCFEALVEIDRHRDDTAAAIAHLEHAVDLFTPNDVAFLTNRALTQKLELQGFADVDVTSSIDAVAASIDTARPDLTPQAAPDGTVTLLFSDIENSTARTAALGDARWMALLREHNGLVREQLAAHGGYEVKSMGDGFMLAFRSARDGLRCAIALQRAFAERNAGATEPIRVRIGLHTGEAIREADDFFGTHVNLAARIGGAAQGDEILVSGLLQALTESAGEFTFDAGRDLELKGITGPQRVFAVEWR